MKTWVVMNDLQIPFQDHRVLDKLVLPFVERLKPHGVVLNGDVVDAYSLSSFDKNPLERRGLDTEVRQAGQLMGRLSACTKEPWWIGGNHEDRIRRYVWKNASALGVLPNLDFPGLFHLVDYGFRWLDYGRHLRLGKLRVTHGSMVRRHSGATARAHLEKYGTSILVGHSHRIGVSYLTNLGGVHAGWENGCLCRLDPEWCPDPNWQQGFSIVHVGDGGFFSVQQIPILGRREFFYGREHFTLKSFS